MISLCGSPILMGLLFAQAPAAPADPAVLAAKIDRHLEKVWKERGLTAAPATDDATLFRRLSLDLIGRIPTASETSAFLEDRDREKVRKTIERLSATPLHQRNMALFWRKIWLPQSQTMARLADGTDEWIAAKLAKRTPYPRMVQEFLVARATSPEGRAADMAPPSFSAFNENKPENLAASSARAFLGINLDCAQCHDHPFAVWTRDQFWETAAFFARPVTAEIGKPGALAVTIPNTNKSLKPRLIKGSNDALPASWKDDEGRVLLAGWITESSNPLFFHNAANRLWSQFFGYGLVEPLDNLVGEHAKDLDPLLNELAEAFRLSGGDTHFLTQAIVSSQAYRASSRHAQKTASPQRSGHGFFSSRPVRGLTGEQLFDSLLVAGGYSLPGSDAESEELLKLRSRFAAKFFVDRSVHAERSVIQSLVLLNGDAFPASPKKGACPSVCAIADGPFSGPPARIEAMFLAVLGRLPTASERQMLAQALPQDAPGRDRRKDLNDLFWILINTVEFSSNH